MSYPAYPIYTTSEADWLGELPEHWKVRRLRFAALEPLKYGANEAAELEDTELPRYIRITDVKADGSLHSDTFRSLPEEVAAPYLLEEGDILLARSGATVGKSFQYSANWGKAAYAGYLIRFRPDQTTIHPRFAYYYFQTECYWACISSTLIQATIQNFSADKYNDLRLPLPNLDEQQLIADFLDYKTAQIDALIAKRKELIERLKEQRTAAITQAVNKGLNPSAPVRDSGISWLGQMPQHWKVRRLKFSISIKGGGTPNTNTPEYWEGDIPWVSPKDMKGTDISTSQDNITELGLKESTSTLIDPGTVLIVVRSGILRHTIPVAINSVPVAINQDMKALIPSEDTFDPNYLLALIFGNQQALLPLWSKPGCTVESIESEYMMNSLLPLPPKEEQEQIASEVNNIKTKIDSMQSKIELAIDRLAEYRTALITAATTGKIDVRNIKLGK